MFILLTTNFNQFSLHFDQNQIFQLIIQLLQYSNHCQLASQEKIKEFNEATYAGIIDQFVLGITLVIPCGVEKIGSQIDLYQYKSRIKNIIIPDTVQIIGFDAFKNCINLSSINIPNSVTQIDSQAFFSCVSLEYISIPDSVIKMGDYIFWNCTKLEDVKLPSNISKISIGMFSYCESLKNISIPKSVKYIEKRAFYNCKALTIVKIPINVEYVGIFAFYGCYSIVTVKFQNLNTEVEQDAFQNSSAQCQYENEYSNISIRTQIKSRLSQRWVSALSVKERQQQCQEIININSDNNYISKNNGCFGIKKFCNNTDNSVNKQIVN